MALWGLWSTNAAWNIEAALKSVALPVWQTVSSVDNLKAAGSAAIGAVVENPLTTAATVAVGAVTYVVYRNKGFGIGLGQFNASFDNFLANAKVQIGLGRKKPSDVQDLDVRMRNMESGLRDARDAESRHHEATQSAIQSLREVLMRRFTTVTDTLERSAQSASENQRALVGNHTALLQQMGSNHTQLSDGLKAVVGETSQMKNQLVRLTPAPLK